MKIFGPRNVLERITKHYSDLYDDLPATATGKPAANATAAAMADLPPTVVAAFEELESAFVKLRSALKVHLGKAAPATFSEAHGGRALTEREQQNVRNLENTAPNVAKRLREYHATH